LPIFAITMIQVFPENAIDALEFSKICDLLKARCRSDFSRRRVDNIRVHVKLEYIEKDLRQANEYKLVQQSGSVFPNDFTVNIERELKMLSMEGGFLKADQLLLIKSLALNIKEILNWFKQQGDLFPNLQQVCRYISYEKEIAALVAQVLDDFGIMRDTASPELAQIRASLERRRQESRRVFEYNVKRYAKLGYLGDISESFLYGRRTLAVLSEYKRIVKGILHGESDTQKTVFIEPEETVEINNDVAALERAETKEVNRILLETTRLLMPFHHHLEAYYEVCGTFDFIRAKALLAIDMDGTMPVLTPHPTLKLVNANHPLLYLKNKNSKATVPLNISLDKHKRILVISGPNAGGKTVAMKTVGLIQLMVQAGMMVPVDATSEIGVFRQIFVEIGDTQSIEQELSTYSAHLKAMKYFLDFANGKTLFFIDELGSGTDPNLGGAFAEAILEQLAAKFALGIVTTHYLNLKAMAGNVRGINNGAMAFDEKNLLPLFRLEMGKPGSSYTFSIAQRNEFPKQVIDRAKQLTAPEHYKLDKVLLTVEQQSVRLKEREEELARLIKENERLKKNFEILTDKEKLKQEKETLQLQNKIKKEELDYLRDTERKFKQIIQDWKRSENKQQVIASAEQVLFKGKQMKYNANAAKKADRSFVAIGGEPKVGDLVRNKTSHQVGTVIEFRDKKAIVKIGNLPFTVAIEECVVVKQREPEKSNTQ
jgi:DNA mismatch repair protein MutS2